MPTSSTAPGPTTRPILRLTNSKPWLAVGLTHLLYIELCCAVNIFRRCAILLRNLNHWTSSINAHRTAKHKPPYAESPGHFQQVEAALNIDLCRPQRLALRHCRQDRGQMDNCVDRSISNTTAIAQDR